MRCDICGSEETYIKDYEHIFNIKNKEIRFTSKRRFCKKCNNLVYDDKLDNLASEIAISKYNEQYGITKEMIIDLRKKYKLSQEQFSKIIGCAKKTLISYEKGKSIPNDCYLIILKSLLLKPETIITLINANKEQFTDKEYEKINSRINESLLNNIKRIIGSDEDKPTEYNGYTKLSLDKIYNMIIYFSKDTIFKVKLLKEMFYADFLCYKESCKSITGLEYAKLPLGPVPDGFENIIYKCIQDKVIDYKEELSLDSVKCYITSKKKFDSTIFNDEEIQILEKVKNKFKDFGSAKIAEFSHKEKAFNETKLTHKISYDYAFDIESI